MNSMEAATHLGQIPAGFPAEVAYCASTLLTILATVYPDCAEAAATLSQAAARLPHTPAKARGRKQARAPAGS